MPERSIDAAAVEYLWRAPIDHWERDPVPVTTCADALHKAFSACGCSTAP